MPKNTAFAQPLGTRSGWLLDASVGRVHANFPSSSETEETAGLPDIAYPSVKFYCKTTSSPKSWCAKAANRHCQFICGMI